MPAKLLSASIILGIIATLNLLFPKTLLAANCSTSPVYTGPCGSATCPTGDAAIGVNFIYDSLPG